MEETRIRQRERNRRWKEEAGEMKWSERNRGSKTGDTKLN